MVCSSCYCSLITVLVLDFVFSSCYNLLLCIFRYYALLAVSVACYIAAFTISGLLFIWFNPSGHDCGLNVFFLVMTMILAFSFGVIALHPKVTETLISFVVLCFHCFEVVLTIISLGLLIFYFFMFFSMLDFPYLVVSKSYQNTLN